MDEVRRAYDKAVSEPTKTEPTTITEDMTNGDVIKVMFPNIKFLEYFAVMRGFNIGDDAPIKFEIYKEWWNAPYNGNFAIQTSIQKEE